MMSTGRAAGGLVDVRDRIGMEDEEKTRRNAMHNTLLDMGMCPWLREEAAFEIGVGTIQIVPSFIPRRAHSTGPLRLAAGWCCRFRSCERRRGTLCSSSSRTARRTTATLSAATTG